MHEQDAETCDRIHFLLDELKLKHLKVLNICGDTDIEYCIKMLSSIMTQASHKMGFLDLCDIEGSPSSISVNLKSISDFDFSDTVKFIFSIYKAKYPSVTPYFDEIMLIASLYYFSQKSCDIVVLKKPLDRSTVINALDPPIINIVTPIFSNDIHRLITDNLVKKGTLEVVSAPQHKDVHKIISDACVAAGCRFTLTIYSVTSIKNFSLFKTLFEYMGSEFSIRSFSPFQVVNAITAIEASKAIGRIGLKINDNDISLGLFHTRFDGKCDAISIDPNIIVSSMYDRLSLSFLVSSLAQVKDQLYNDVCFYIDSTVDIDDSLLSSKLSSYDIPHKQISRIDYRAEDLKSFKKRLYEIADELTESLSGNKASAIFIGGDNFIKATTETITAYLNDR